MTGIVNGLILSAPLWIALGVGLYFRNLYLGAAVLVITFWGACRAVGRNTR